MKDEDSGISSFKLHLEVGKKLRRTLDFIKDG